MHLYRFLSKFTWLNSYKRKLMLLAFIGTHIPLLTLFGFLVHLASIGLKIKLMILGVTTLATLVSTAVTLLAINNLLQPIHKTSQALQTYWRVKALLELPTEYTDEVGLLMANTYKTLQKVDSLVHYVVDYDRLTSIPNRSFFKSQLLKATDTLQTSENIVVFLIDIDGFKEINTVGSNKTGDRILKAIAQRLTSYVNNKEHIARLGSDEFAFFIKSSIPAEGYLTIAKTLQRRLNEPYLISPTSIQLTTSIGIAAYPTDSYTPSALIDYAYNALQQAQDTGSNNIQRYSPEITKRLQNRANLAKDLGRAIEKQQLVLHYQPRIDWRNNNIVGVECLLRWQHPERGLIPPNQFIPLAEETGDILPIGEWVLRRACQQKKDWEENSLADLHLTNFKLAVNLSVRQIEAPGLVDMVQRILDDTQLSPYDLELEVTESLFISEIDHTASVLEALHQKGIRLALDDFGTGYASLNYLRQFPFDILKIDRSFVQDIVHSPDAAEVTRAIVALAKGLSLDLIAEGIETEEQLNRMKAYDCHEIQGYYFSHPLTADKFSQWMEQYR